MSVIQDWSIIALFGILILGPTAATIIKPSMKFSETENRVLAQRPTFNTAAVLSGKYEADYEEYLTDQFVLRDDWISLKTYVEKLLFKRESKGIYFAEDGYLIEKHGGLFASDRAMRNTEMLRKFVQRYTERFGAGHIMVILVPNAVEILQDKLPPFAPPTGEAGYLNRIAKTLPGSAWLDATRILQEYKNEDLYYRTDHHWKTLAAFYVYREFAMAQGYQVPALEDYNITVVSSNFQGTLQSKLVSKTVSDTIELFLPKKPVAYTMQREGSGMTDSVYDYTALETKDMYAVYFGGNQGLLKINTSIDNDRKLLVIKDSYANCFIPFMIGEFRTIDILDLRYDRRNLSERIEDGGYTDILILYNAAGFAEDMNIGKLMN